MDHIIFSIVKVYTKGRITKAKLSTKRGIFSKILVAIDGSDQSMDAGDYAIEISKKDNAQLIALTVSHIPLSSYGLRSAPDTLTHEKEKNMLEAEQWFSRFNELAKHNNIKLKTDLIDSQMSIAAAIVEYAEHERVDLIILGTRGRSGFKKLLLGSVASDVVNYATCPVMVVR